MVKPVLFISISNLKALKQPSDVYAKDKLSLSTLKIIVSVI